MSNFSRRVWPFAILAVSRWRPCIKPPRKRRTARHAQDQYRRSRRAAQRGATAPYVAKELGYFAKRCIDANVVPIRGRQSATSVARRARSALVSVGDVAIGRGLRVEADLGFGAAHAAGLHGGAGT